MEYDQQWLQQAEDPMLPFEPRHLERAISNLVSNAQKYADSWVGIRVELTPGECNIVVEDDGPGIHPADREKVWEPFARLDNSRTRATGGYGLGLSIVKQIAHRHGGFVSIGTSSKGGAAFTFSWPINQNQPPGLKK